MEIPSKDIYAQVYGLFSTGIIFIVLSSTQTWKSSHKDNGISFSLLFLCASRKRHRQTVSASALSSQFIASKTQETHSRGDPENHDL